MNNGRYTNLRNGHRDAIKQGGAFDWGWFERARDDFVNAVAPISSELIGPVASALTGKPISNPKDYVSSDPAQQAKNMKQLEELGKKALADILNKGISPEKKGKGFKKL